MQYTEGKEKKKAHSFIDYEAIGMRHMKIKYMCSTKLKRNKPQNNRHNNQIFNTATIMIEFRMCEV